MTQTTVRPPRKFAPKRLSVWFLCLLTVVGLCAGRIWSLCSPFPSGAYAVLSTARWTGKHAGGYYESYQWLPNGELAYLTTDSKGWPQVCYQKMNDRGPVGMVKYGPELPQERWSNRFFPSPDEQWVAYIEFSLPRKFTTFLVSADGKSKRRESGRFMGWLRDSHNYLNLSNPYESTNVHHLDSPSSEEVPRAPMWNDFFPLTMLATGPTFTIGNYFSNPRPYSGGIPLNSPQMLLRSYTAEHPAIVAQEWQATVPPGMSSGRACPSPDGQHLLWDTQRPHTSRWDEWLGRFNRSRRKTPTVETHYFVSDLHGAHLHPVLTNITGGTLTLYPRWTPDSKHLSFIYKDQLYLALVN